jgi:hypothetical protein
MEEGGPAIGPLPMERAAVRSVLTNIRMIGYLEQATEGWRAENTVRFLSSGRPGIARYPGMSSATRFADTD